MRFTHRSIVLPAGAAIALAAMLAACAASGPGFVPVPSSSIMTSTSGSVSLPSTTESSYTVTGTLPSADAVVSVKETISTTAPSGVKALLARRDDTSTNVDLLYVTLTPSATVTLSAAPSFSFASSGITSGTAYSLGEYQNGVWTAPFGAGEEASGTSVAFPSVSEPLTIAPSEPVTFVLYSGTVATPSPSASPTPYASPGVLSFDVTNSTTQTFAVSETGYSGVFTATMTCTENPTGQTPAADAFVAEFSGGTTTATETPTSAGAAATFTVESGAETGSCAVSVADSSGNTTSVTVDVSSTSVTIDRSKRL